MTASNLIMPDAFSSTESTIAGLGGAMYYATILSPCESSECASALARKIHEGLAGADQAVVIV
jgi:hypothetical protein